MTQYEKSCSTLELPAILEQLAQQAVSASAKELALALAPSTDTAEVKKRLAETSAARAMMVTRGSPSFSRREGRAGRACSARTWAGCLT